MRTTQLLRDYVEPKYRDNAPRVVLQPDGSDAFIVPGMKRPVALGVASLPRRGRPQRKFLQAAVRKKPVVAHLVSLQGREASLYPDA